MRPVLLAGASPETGEAYTEEEWELREQLRLEALERRARSLRSSPVAQTYRQLNRGGGAGETVAGANAEEDAAAAVRAEGAEAIARALGTFEGVAESLEDDIAAEAEADRAFLAALTGGAAGTPDAPMPAGSGASGGQESGAGREAGVPGGPLMPSGPGRDYNNPVKTQMPNDPLGWERIYEGSFLEGVLVTQLSGDFPAPVLAQVAMPFYSADRQRILIPRGSRAVGTAAAVTGQDQERLAVGFHRLIFPDGRWIPLEFHGLNQVGEGALKDRVNRHYFSMFAAVGAVGAISGLTLRNSNPYATGSESFRAGAGQGLGQGATQILQRFLNRLPTPHYPGGPSASDLVHFRCSSPPLARRMK